MSIFDKYNINPYVKTFAGAPIKTFQTVAQGLQTRADQNLDRMNELKILGSTIKTMKADEDYKNKKLADIDNAIAMMSEAPEYATRQIKQLSTEFKTDKTLINATNSYKKMQESLEAMRKGEYSDFQKKRFYDEMARYEGAEKGDVFNAPFFYEEQSIGELVDDRVDGIKPIKDGGFEIDKTRGVIITSKGEEVDANRVVRSALGVLSDKTVQRQVRDELMYHAGDRVRKGENGELLLAVKDEAGNETLVPALQQYFLEQYIDPAIAKYAYTGQRFDAKAYGKKGFGTSEFKDPGMMPQYFGTDLVQNTLEDINSGSAFMQAAGSVQTRLDDPNSYAGTNYNVQDDVVLQAQLQKVWDRVLDDETSILSPATRAMMKAGGFADVGMLGRFNDMTLRVSQAKQTDARYREAYGPMYYTESAEYAKVKDQEEVDYKQLIRDAIPGQWTDDQLEDFVQDLRKFSYGSYWNTDLTDMLEKGIADNTSPTKFRVLPTAVGRDITAQVTPIVTSYLFNQNFNGLEMQNATGKMTGKYTPVEPEMGQEYDWSKMKVQALGTMNNGGTMQIVVPHQDNNKPAGVFALRIPDGQSDVNARLGETFRKLATQTTDNVQFQTYMDLSMSMTRNEVISSALERQNLPSTKTKTPLSTPSGMLEQALGRPGGDVYLIVDNASGDTYYVDATGARVGKTYDFSRNGVARATNELYEIAAAKSAE